MQRVNQVKFLTCWIGLKVIKDVFTFRIISWILFNRRRSDSQWSNPTCCLSSTLNTIPGNFRRRGIGRHDIDRIICNITSQASEELKWLLTKLLLVYFSIQHNPNCSAMDNWHLLIWTLVLFHNNQTANNGHGDCRIPWSCSNPIIRWVEHIWFTGIQPLWHRVDFSHYR